ncbi:HD domain-containing protein [Streptomyces sp. ODS28]|uniref:HD domain-containing protein n=1 Tax=Streptomyces sp. ODS28 TaxID=3136688 RepID=UPI0031EFBC01
MRTQRSASAGTGVRPDVDADEPRGGPDAGDVRPAVADSLGAGGRYRDPLWRVCVELTELERELLRCWWVRRLGFVAHAGAAAMSSTQSYSRLEHSLGLLALTAHFAPADRPARAAALLHDVGHLPLSHTFEGVAGLDHHALGAERVAELGPLLRRYGVDPEEVLAVDAGERPSVLSGGPGALKLDHLDSLVRSGRAHGRTAQPPPYTLDRVRIADGRVSTDADTGGYLAGLVADENRWLCSHTNAVPNGVVRHLAAVLLRDATERRRAELAAMTDDEFWALLLSEPATAEHTRLLRRDPAAWRVTDIAPGSGPAEESVGAGCFTYEKKRLYLDMPLVDGRPLAPDHPAFGHLPALPWRCRIEAPAGIEAPARTEAPAPRECGGGSACCEVPGPAGPRAARPWSTP